jgi:putative transposase
MPYRKQQFVNGEIYHIVARRIESNLLYKDNDDCYRGIFSIYEFNNNKPITIRECRVARAQIKKVNKINKDSIPLIDNRDILVEILAFCLMPNHIHLLLRQFRDNGISNFMQKFGAGYSAYFKNKYNLKQKGYFFQGRFVAVHIKTDEQLKTVFVYIHTNPVSLIEPKWKETGIKNPEKAIEFVKNYKWSSCSDYIGKKNFPSVTEREFILKIMGGSEGCKEFIEDWIRYKGEIKKFANLVLE